MWPLFVLNLIGLVVLIVSCVQVVRDKGSLHSWPFSARLLGALSLCAAGCVWTAAIQYKLFYLLYNRGQRTDDLVALQLTLQEPLRIVYIRITGEDPFSGRSDARVL